MESGKIKKVDVDAYRGLISLSQEELKYADVARKIKIELIANLCGDQSYPAEVLVNGKKRKILNGIDYLMYVQKLSYHACVKFIMDNFKDNKKAVYKRVKSDDVAEYIKIKSDIIRRQFRALGNPLVRITLKDNDDAGKTKNLGRKRLYDENGKKIIEKFFNVDEVVDLISQLNFYNGNEKERKNIFITPIEHQKPIDFLHMFVDDVKGEKYDELIRVFGYPNLIIESSANNYQFIYNVPISEDEYENSKQGRKKYINFFREVNFVFGDKKISGLRHPFRLAGFVNTKPKYYDENGKSFFCKIKFADVKAENNIRAIIEGNIAKYNMKSSNFTKKYLNDAAEHDFTVKKNDFDAFPM